MKRKNLLKSLLVAVGLLVGGNAWADTFTGSVSFEAKSRITNNNDGTFTTASNAGNGYALALADLSGVENINGATSITLDFDFNLPKSRFIIGIGDKNTRGTNANGSSKSTYNTDGLIMRFGTTDGTYFRVNGGTNNSDAFGVNAHCTFTLDVANKKYTYSITKKDDNTKLFSGSEISTSITSSTVVEAYSWVGSSTISLSNVSYSFEYNAASYTYTVNAIDADNNILKVLDTNVSQEPKTVVYPYAINVNGDWYVTNETVYGVNVTSINPTANITYIKAEDIVAFFEAESAAGTNTQYSNGGYGTVAAQNKRNRGISGGTLERGKYKFIAKLVADGNSGRQITIREGDKDPLAFAAGSNTNKVVEDEFNIFATTENLYINGANSGTEKTNLSTSFDYVIIKKISDEPTIESMSIVGDFSEFGWDATKGIAMTQDASEPEKWTAVIDDYVISSEKLYYEYKAVANLSFVEYVLPAGNNQNYDFDYDGAGAGTYKLTFTANTSSHTVELAIQKKDLSTYTVVGAYDNYTNQYSSFFDPSGTNIWDKDATANDLINNGDGTYSKIYWNVGLTEPGTIYYKVVKNHDWTENWGMSDKQDGNAEYIVNEAGTYNIKFTFNPKTAFSDGYNVKCEVIPYTVKKHIGKYNDKCYATYCSPYALDFSTLTNLVAYNATISGDYVSFNTESETASGEGMLLMATDEGDYDIPTTFDVAPNIDNALIGVLSETVIDEVGIFVLMNDAKGIGFYKTQKAFTVGANTAYLPKVSTAREFIGFGDDTTTSINAISNEKMNGEVYNLNGQRVVAPAKGLYIVNGKKVVLK